MTANQLVNLLHREISKLSSGDVEILMNGEPIFVYPEIVEGEGCYYINLIDTLN